MAYTNELGNGMCVFRTNYFYHGRLSWDEKSSNGRYVRENCKPLLRYMTADDEEHRALFDLIGHMLEYEPSHRLTLKDSLEHQFFRKLPLEYRLHELDAIEATQERNDSSKNECRERSHSLSR